MATIDADSAPKLDASALNALLHRLFPGSDPRRMVRAVEVEAERVLVIQALRDDMLRPGPLVSGPSLMNVADVAAYALILARLGEVPMAVTSSLTIHFLRGAAPADVRGEARFLRLGRRSAVIEVCLWTQSRDRLAAQATVTYVLPPAGEAAI